MAPFENFFFSNNQVYKVTLSCTWFENCIIDLNMLYAMLSYFLLSVLNTKHWCKLIAKKCNIIFEIFSSYDPQ